MNIQIYIAKKNPDVLKAERFFKERRIAYQLMDLKKHTLGRKELDVFVNAVGAKALVDREGKKALERPVAHMSTDSLIIAELLNDPSALVSPIVRNGSHVTVGADEAVWRAWVEASNQAK
ncbi:MAG: ArsC family transcriptional regulator [Clostridiales bacterium]|nr:ArsC family transcriptional regulator [Clostridiales bacterium]MDO4350531.1 ArsC family transcriptional regulator [Eubacteriales bacterium]MDY4008542.1 ArsC family transcriptional regulator [Candidatus Limiplasma sp.]